jgi:hypothetical protein
MLGSMYRSPWSLKDGLLSRLSLNRDAHSCAPEGRNLSRDYFCLDTIVPRRHQRRPREAAAERSRPHSRRGAARTQFQRPGENGRARMAERTAIAGFVVGCGLGAWCQARAGLWSLTLPTGLSLLALAMAPAKRGVAQGAEIDLSCGRVEVAATRPSDHRVDP